MKKVLIILVLTSILLESCLILPATPTATVLPIATALPSATIKPTRTTVPTRTPLPPTSTATITPLPTATITPMSVVKVDLSPLTLTELNAGQMKRLNVIGTGTPHDLQFSPDGKRLAVATGRGIYLYDGETFEQTDFIDVNDSVSAIAFSPDGNVLAVAVDGKASLWNALSGQKISDFEGGMVSIFKLAYGRGGYVAAMGTACRGCGSSNQLVVLWNASSGRQIFSQKDIWYWTEALAFSADGQKLYFAGQDGLTVIDSDTGKQIAIVDIDPINILLGKNDLVFITSLESDNQIYRLDNQQTSPFAFCYIYLASADDMGACLGQARIVIFDLATGNEIQSISIDVEPDKLRGKFALSPDGNFLVYLDETVLNIIDLMSTDTAKFINFPNFENIATSIMEIDGADEYVVATINSDGKVDIYNLQSGQMIRRLKLDCCEISGIAFAPDHKTVATIDSDNLRLWDLQSQQIIYEAGLRGDYSGPIAFSPAGSSVFVTDLAEDFVLEYNLQTGKTENHGENSFAYNFADPFAVENYHFNTRGDLVMLGYDSRWPIIQNVNTKEQITIPFEVKTDIDFIEAFALSSDGKYLALGNPTDIFVWNLGTITLLSTLNGHKASGADGWFGKIRSMIFNPQSNLLISVGWDGTTRLWDIFTGQELRKLNVCCSASFTPDGRYLVTAGQGVIHVWGIP